MLCYKFVLKQGARCCAMYHLRDETKRRARFKKNEGVASWQLETKEPLLLEEVKDNLLFEGIRNRLIEDFEKVGAKAIFPLIGSGKLLGFLTLGEKRDGTPYRWDEIDILSSLCCEAANVFGRMQTFDTQIKSYLGAIEALAQSVESKDSYTKGHCERVSNYAISIAKRMGLPVEMIEEVRLAGILHDVGKLGIRDEVLLKPGALSEEEFEEIRNHPVRAKNILLPIQITQNVTEAILHHHEKLSGTGYPDGLKGGEISLSTRILAVADAYDAMTSQRVYRNKFAQEEAIGELLKASGKDFDSTVVKTFVSILKEERG